MPTPPPSGTPAERSVLDICWTYTLMAMGLRLKRMKLYLSDHSKRVIEFPDTFEPCPRAVPPPPNPDGPARLVSPDGLKILRVLADKGASEVKAIATHSGVERSKVYVLVGDMAARGLIRDDGEGYVIADQKAWEEANN
jgi:hypothetical protein